MGAVGTLHLLRDLRLEGPYTMRPATAEDKSRNKYGENDVSGTMGAEEDLRVPAPNTVSIAVPTVGLPDDWEDHIGNDEMEGLADDRDAFSETMPVGAESLGTLGAIEAVTRLGGNLGEDLLCVAFDEALEAYSEAHTGDSQDIGKGGENRGPVSGMSLFPQVQQSGSDWVGLSKEQRGRGEFAAGLKAHRGGKYGLVGGAGGAERHAVMTRQCDFGDAQQPGRGDDGMAHAGPLQREASPETPTDRAMWMARHHCWHPALDWMGKWEGGAEGCMLGRKGEGGGDRRWYDECEAGDRRTGADGGQGGRREQKSPCEKRGAPPGRGWWCGGSARQPREEGFPACVRIGGVRGTRARNWVIGVGVDPGSEAGAEEQWPRRDVWTDGTAWGDVGGVSARPFDGLDVGGSLRGEAMGDGGVGEEEWDMLESVARDMAEECLGEGRVEVLQEAMLAFFIAGLQARRQ